MFNVQGKTVREIALEMPVTTRVFEEFKIDYCCHGYTLFEEACQDAGVNAQAVKLRIDGVIDDSQNGGAAYFAELPLSELIDHILAKHHVYTKAEINQLTPLMAKVASRHGEHNAFLFELKNLFQAICDDLGPHMIKEEMVLFPYIQKLVYNQENNMTTLFPPFGTVGHPISTMNAEHEAVGELLEKMRLVTNDYALPDGACPSFTALYHRLGEFERDIHQHIHLENNVLFPRSIELEKTLISQTVH